MSSNDEEMNEDMIDSYSEDMPTMADYMMFRCDELLSHLDLETEEPSDEDLFAIEEELVDSIVSSSLIMISLGLDEEDILARAMKKLEESIEHDQSCEHYCEHDQHRLN